MLLGADPTKAGYSATQYFVEYVSVTLMSQQYGDDQLYGGGLRIYTTLDLNMQQDAYNAVTSTLNDPGDPSGALVAIDDQGDVRAMMGGTDYDTSKVNLATGLAGGGSGRQPGSTFKAFALAEAVKEGYSIDSVFASPSSIVLPHANAGADWHVSGGCCGGQTNLVVATQDSVNTVYAQLMVKLGPAKVVAMAHELGVAAPLPDYPSLVLGSGDVSVLDMASSAYSTFANQGVRITPRVVTRVERADGTVLYDAPPVREQILSADQTAKVTYCLQKVVQLSVATGRNAQIGRDQAGKTGTTTNNKDAWFVGYTPTLTAAAWMGYPIPRAMTSVHGETVQGANLPSEIWKKFMLAAVANTDTGTFPDFGDVTSGVDINTGHSPIVLPRTGPTVPTSQVPTTLPTQASTSTPVSSPPTSSPVTVPPTSTPVSEPPTTGSPPPTTGATARAALILAAAVHGFAWQMEAWDTLVPPLAAEWRWTGSKEALMSSTATRTPRTAPQIRAPEAIRRLRPDGHDHGLRRPRCPDRGRGRRRPGAGRRLAGQGGAGLRRRPCRSPPRRHRPPRGCGGPGQAVAADRGRPALDELPRLCRRHVGERSPADQGGRPGGQARGRTQARSHGRRRWSTRRSLS